MTSLEIILDSLPRTGELGAALARLLEPGDVVLLEGELGAGKTTLVHAVASAMGVPPGRVSSPTFTMMQEYETGRGVTLLHLDAYRMAGDDEEELLGLGWDRARSADTIAFIEWGDRVAALLDDLLDEPPARVRLSHEGEHERLAVLEAPERWTARSGWGDLRTLATGSVFGSEREQWADLYRWLHGSYQISRPLDPGDTDDDPL